MKKLSETDGNGKQRENKKKTEEDRREEERRGEGKEGWEDRKGGRKEEMKEVSQGTHK